MTAASPSEQITELKRGLLVYRLLLLVALVGIGFLVWSLSRVHQVSTYGGYGEVWTVDLDAQIAQASQERMEVADFIETYFESDGFSAHMHYMGRQQTTPLHLHKKADEAVIVAGGTAVVEHVYGEDGERRFRQATHEAPSFVGSPPYCGHEYVNPHDDRLLAALVFAAPKFAGNFYVRPDDPRLLQGPAPYVFDPARISGAADVPERTRAWGERVWTLALADSWTLAPNLHKPVLAYVATGAGTVDGQPVDDNTLVHLESDAPITWQATAPMNVVLFDPYGALARPQGVSMIGAWLATLLGCGTATLQAPSAPPTPTDAPPVDELDAARRTTTRPDVVLVVLDTVRADHTSLCGYGRPTTPFLDQLVAEHGGAASCEVRTPGAWTLPTHASFFTGLLPTEHHYDSLKVPDWSEVPTLAETLGAEGYATALVTANPVLTRAEGLAEGFDVVRSATEIHSWRGEVVVRQTRSALKSLDPDVPWFVVVNIMDAHDPWGAVPGDAGWVPERPRLDFHVKERDAGHPYHRFLDGRMPESEARAFVDHVTDVYDWGVHRADAMLRGVTGVLARLGRRDRGLRLVVTSDHGEFLGEHGLLRHGGWVWEPVVRVPLVVVDTREGVTPSLPDGPLGGTGVHGLLRTGSWPDRTPPVAFTSRSNFAENPGSNSVAVWRGPRKLVWREGEVLAYDLAADPGEQAPGAAPDGPLRARLDRFHAAYEAHVAWRKARDVRLEDQRLLRALGYVEQAEVE